MCFGGGGGSETTVESETKIPEYLQQFSQETLDFARDLRDRPFQSYTTGGTPGTPGTSASTTQNLPAGARVENGRVVMDQPGGGGSGSIGAGPIGNETYYRSGGTRGPEAGLPPGNAGGGGGGGTIDLGPLSQFQTTTPGTPGTAGTPGDPRQRFAELTPDTLAGFEMVRDATGAWRAPWEVASNTATDVANRQVTPFTEADIGAYMNPYQQQVIDRAMAELNRQMGIDMNATKGRLANQGAYRSDQGDVALGQVNRGYGDVKANTLAQLLSSGYEDAAGRFYADEAARQSSDQLRLGAAGQMSEMGRLASQLGFADASAMIDIGEQQRQQAQQQLDFDYAEFLREWNYPAEILAMMNSTVSGQPYSTESTQTQTAPGGSGLAQTIGALGSFAGGAGTLITALSSREYKEDDAPAETILDGMKKLPVRAWRYKSEVGLGTERHVGPYAEDFHETFGLGDGKTIPYVDAIGVTMAAVKELAGDVDGLKAFAEGVMLDAAA